MKFDELGIKIYIIMLGVSLIGLILMMFVTTFVFPDDAPIQQINLFHYVKMWFMKNPENNVVFCIQVLIVISIISMFIGIFFTQKAKVKK